MTALALVGNPKPCSRTYHAACLLIEKLTGHPADRAVDLVDLGADLLSPGSDRVTSLRTDVQDADLLVVASPTYKASYTGLLKWFLDSFPRGALAGVTAIPLMLGGDWHHSLAPEIFLKPVLAELGASMPTRSLFLLESEYAQSDTMSAWLEVARRQLPARLLPAPSPEREGTERGVARLR